jgi:hypothetical protein
MDENELEAHRQRLQQMMRETMAPLLARLDAAEASLAAERQRGAERDAERLREARARFKASLAVELISGQLASNTFDWNVELREIDSAIRTVNSVLVRCGLEEYL